MYFPLVQSLMYEQDGSLFYVFNLVYVNLFELVQDVLLFLDSYICSLHYSMNL